MDIKLEKLSEIFTKAFGENVQLLITSDKENLSEWDSINHLNLIVELESSLNVSFLPSEIESIKSVKDLIEILKNK
jgi:acyl carrier protein